MYDRHTAADDGIDLENAYDADRVAQYVPIVLGHTDVHDGNRTYLTRVAKRAAFERMGFSPLMYDADTPGMAYVNVVNMAKGKDENGRWSSTYTVAFEGAYAVSCTCPANENWGTCKHRVRAQDILEFDVWQFIADAETDADDDDDDDDVRYLISLGETGETDADDADDVRYLIPLGETGETDADDADADDETDAAAVGVPLNRFEGADRTTGSIADGLANLRAIKGD